MFQVVPFLYNKPPRNKKKTSKKPETPHQNNPQKFAKPGQPTKITKGPSSRLWGKRPFLWGIGRRKGRSSIPWIFFNVPSSCGYGYPSEHAGLQPFLIDDFPRTAHMTHSQESTTSIPTNPRQLKTPVFSSQSCRLDVEFKVDAVPWVPALFLGLIPLVTLAVSETWHDMVI